MQISCDLQCLLQINEVLEASLGQLQARNHPHAEAVAAALNRTGSTEQRSVLLLTPSSPLRQKAVQTANASKAAGASAGVPHTSPAVKLHRQRDSCSKADLSIIGCEGREECFVKVGWIFVSERGEGDICVGHACMLMESALCRWARRHWWAEV